MCADDGTPITVTVPVGDIEVVCQIWRTDVGRVPLYLLDADRPENSETARWITSRLYIGDEDTRLAQYLLLGIGGVRALEAMGIEPSIVHLNEGHAAFVSLELARREYSGNGSLSAALEIARRRTVFTTHTPVPAGNDTYPAHQVEVALSHVAGTLGVDPAEIISLGRTNPDEEAEPFGVTQFALRTSRAANGVSRRHGEVAREMWQAMWAEREVDDVPITHVTNGVHIPTWLGKPIWELLDRHLGDDWLDRATDPATWVPVDDIPAKELWDVRTRAARAADRVRAPPRGRRPARARRTARLRRGRRRVRPRRADGRLRPPAGDLQAAEPAAAGRRAGDADRRRRPPRAGAAGRQGAPARRRRQEARPGPVHA